MRLPLSACSRAFWVAIVAVTALSVCGIVYGQPPATAGSAATAAPTAAPAATASPATPAPTAASALPATTAAAAKPAARVMPVTPRRPRRRSLRLPQPPLPRRQLRHASRFPASQPVAASTSARAPGTEYPIYFTAPAAYPVKVLGKRGAWLEMSSPDRGSPTSISSSCRSPRMGRARSPRRA